MRARGGFSIGLSAAAQAAIIALMSLLTTASATPTIDGTYGLYRLTNATGPITVTLSAANWQIGETRYIRKCNTTVNGITLAPPAGGTINGGVADATVLLFGSTVAPATADPRPCWAVTRVDTNAWEYS